MVGDARVLDASEVARGDRMATGGVGSVFRIDGDSQRLYKEFLPVANGVRLENLHAWVDLVGAVDEDTRNRLIRTTSWPESLVVREGETIGYTMSLAPDEFWTTATTVAGESPRLRTVDLLMQPSDRLERLTGDSVAMTSRLAVLKALAEAILFLHNLGITIGDLAPRNVAYTAKDGGRVFLIDTDGFSVGAVAAFPALETTGWSTAELIGQAERRQAATDVLKFAAIALRTIASDPTVFFRDVEQLPGGAESAFASLFERSFEKEAESRPGIGEWCEALDRTIAAGAIVEADIAATEEVVDQQRSPGEATGLRVLLMGTEWLPWKGGLSQVNRSLAIGLARRGHKVVATSLKHSATELQDASEYGVDLVVPEVVAGYPNLHIQPPSVVGQFDVVVGHDRFTGLEAATQARKHFPGSCLVQVLHTIPEELEWIKGHPDAMARVEERQGMVRSFGAEADVVCGIGPRIARHAASMLHDGFNPPAVLRLDPGFEFGAVRPAGRTVAPDNSCLILGRSEDPGVKGLDLAALAFSSLPDDIVPSPRLVVRGAHSADGGELHSDLCQEFRLNRADLEVRPFDPARGAVRRDLLRATVVLMPSRSEGFGLVALEAIEVGTPPLISSRSGLAELILEIAPAIAERLVVKVDDNLIEDAERWRNRIADVLRNPQVYVDATLQLWDELHAAGGWTTAAAVLEASLSEHIDRS